MYAVPYGCTIAHDDSLSWRQQGDDFALTITFHHRIDAGQHLAERLLDLRDNADTIVLGLPRGGLPVAAEVARAIHATLDILLVRKIGVVDVVQS